jgi:hypothetical protein
MVEARQDIVPKFYTKCAAYPYYLFILYLDFKNLNTSMRYALVNRPEPFRQMKHWWLRSATLVCLTRIGNLVRPTEEVELLCNFIHWLCMHAESKRKHAIITAYWPSVRSVLWNIRPTFFSMDRATKERGPCKKTEVWYFTVQTEQARSIIGLLYGWTESVSICFSRELNRLSSVSLGNNIR